MQYTEYGKYSNVETPKVPVINTPLTPHGMSGLTAAPALANVAESFLRSILILSNIVI